MNWLYPVLECKVGRHQMSPSLLTVFVLPEDRKSINVFMKVKMEFS